MALNVTVCNTPLVQGRQRYQQQGNDNHLGTGNCKKCRVIRTEVQSIQAIREQEEAAAPEKTEQLAAQGPRVGNEAGPVEKALVPTGFTNIQEVSWG